MSSQLRKLDPEFHKLLLQLTVEYLTYAPEDFIDFAIQFLKNKKDKRDATGKSISSDESEGEIDEDIYANRGTIFRPNIDIHEDFTPKIIPKSEELRNNLKHEMEKIVVFRSLTPKDLDLLVDIMEKKEVNTNDIIIKQNDEGDYFYIIESGKFTAYISKDGNEEILKTYDNKGYFGELALMYDVPRYCSVRADSNGVLWSIDRNNFHRTAVRSSMAARNQYLKLMKNVPILSYLSDSELSDLIDCVETKIYQPGETIINQGDDADGMYFVISGRAVITVRPQEDLRKEVEVKQVTAGDYFGELALVTHQPRAASVHAVDVIECAFLNTMSFERLLGPCIYVMKRNISTYEAQMKSVLNAAI